MRKNPAKYLDSKVNKNQNLDRTICDFIAGMTDRFAINLYNKSK
jgi:dGTP triphosphohydrolase